MSDKAELTRLLGRGMRADVDPMGFGIYQSASVLGLSVEQSIHGEKTNTAFLVQGGLGLPDREDYLSADPGKTALRARYREYIRKMLALAGFDRADERASAVLALETAIAQSQGTREASANDHNADNVWTRSDFARRAPGMDWTVFFDAAGLARQEEFVVWQPSAVTGLAALVASQPLEAWKDYLRFHAIHDFADVLPRAFAEQALALRAATGAGPQPSRAERALAATQSAMSDALGRMYAERYFPADQKARVERISDNVRAALTKRVEAATWMSPATKASALSKLQTLYVGIGYPDQWEDYSSLTVDPADPLGNLRRVADRDYQQADRPARPARRPEVLVHLSADGRRAARVPAERVRHVGRAAGASQVRPRVLRRRGLRIRRRAHRTRRHALHRHAGCRLRHRAPACGTGGPPRTCSASRPSRSRSWISSRRTSRSRASRSTAS